MKKRKTGKRPTRARCAVRSVAVMLCTLLVCNILGGGHLTRAMALRDGKQRYGVYEKTHELASLPAGNIRKTLRVTLMVSENVTYCGASNFYALLGWQEASGSVLDCSDGERVHAGCWSMVSGHGMNRALFYWGRIDDAAVGRAEIVRRHVRYKDNEFVAETAAVTPLELIEDGGHRYFLAGGPIAEQGFRDSGYDEYDLVGYDSGDNEVLRYAFGTTFSSSYS